MKLLPFFSVRFNVRELISSLVMRTIFHWMKIALMFFLFLFRWRQIKLYKPRVIFSVEFHLPQVAAMQTQLALLMMVDSVSTIVSSIDNWIIIGMFMMWPRRRSNVWVLAGIYQNANRFDGVWGYLGKMSQPTIAHFNCKLNNSRRNKIVARYQENRKHQSRSRAD